MVVKCCFTILVEICFVLMNFPRDVDKFSSRWKCFFLVM